VLERELRGEPARRQAAGSPASGAGKTASAGASTVTSIPSSPVVFGTQRDPIAVRALERGGPLGGTILICSRPRKMSIRSRGRVPTTRPAILTALHVPLGAHGQTVHRQLDVDPLWPSELATKPTL
jgi:hypothetical protein